METGSTHTQSYPVKLVELINISDIPEKTAEFYFQFIVEGIKRGK